MFIVKKVTSNLKSKDGKPYTHELAQHTLIVGPNGAGKSAITQSIQLGLWGYATGALGRRQPIKLPAHLMRLASPLCDGIEIVLETGLGVAKWALSPGKRAVSASVRTGASMEDTRDAFSGSAAAAAAWLAGRFPSTPLPMDEFVGRKGYDKLVETVNGLRAPPAVISDWMALGDSLLKRVRALDAEAKMLKTLLGDLPERPETPPTDKRMMFRAAALAMEDWAKGNAVRAKLSVGTSELPAQQEGESWAKTAERLLEAIIVDRETARQRTQRASLTARLASVESESADVSVVGELLEQVIIEKVRASVLPTFEQIVQSAMPTFRLDSGLFVPGRDEGGQTYWGLSGSEEIEALICMAAMNPVPGAVNCIIGDDRDFDPYHLSEMMKALDDAPSQVILTATKPPVGRWRGSWKIIDLTPASE